MLRYYVQTMADVLNMVIAIATACMSELHFELLPPLPS